MGTGHDDGAIKRIDEIGGFRGGAGGDFQDIDDPVFFIAGIDALGCIAGVEIAVERQSGYALENRYADFFRACLLYTSDAADDM
jgi:hypothetical protein